MRLTHSILRMALDVPLAKPKKNVFVTGVPGVGKTTLIQKVCDALESENLECQGFYTKEVRQEGQRVGFDVVTLNGKTAPLARVVDRDNPAAARGYMVGRYCVQLHTFEQTALPSLRVKPEESTRVVVIDEIGKMELFSRSFQQTVRELVANPKCTILASIPAPGKANPFVEDLRHRDDSFVFTVTTQNRYNLIEEVTSAVKESLEVYGT